MKTILLRLSFAWKAFWLIPFHFQYENLHYYCDLRKGNHMICDNENIGKCTNKSEVAMAFTNISFTIKEEDFYHVCKECAEKYKGKKDKYSI